MRSRTAFSILSVLSVDLFIQILEKLADPCDRKAWRLVCRDFLRTESIQRKQLKVFRHESLPALLKRYGSIELVDLSVCPRVDDRTILACFGGGRNRCLRTVNLSRASAVRWWGLEVLVGSCPMLEELDLSYCCGVGDREVAAVARAKGLKVLLVTRCVGVTDVGLARVAVGCGGLERLGLKWCMEITDIGMELLAKKCTSLKNLDISYLKVSNRSLQAIAFMGELEVLSMVGCSDVDDNGLKFLKNGNCSLRVLDVSRCENVTSLGLASVIEQQNRLRDLNAGHCFPELTPLFLSKLKHPDKNNLNSVKLDGFQLSVSSLQTIGSHCKSLVEIGLSKCKGVTDEGIRELVTSCTDLRILDLTCCHLLTDNALSAIADACKNLTCLELESCTLITEKGLDRIAASCCNLEEIDLTDCGINDTALKCLSRCSNLTKLKLGLCSNITDKGLFYIGSNCKMLRELDLYRCAEIGDDGLAALAGGCKKLKKLNLCYCSQITDHGMKHLSGLQELSDLEIRRLTNVTGAGITAIAIGCRSLVELDLKRCYSVEDTSLWALAQHCQNLKQVNVSYCPITDVGLCVLLGNLRCLQDVKLVHLSRVSVEGLEISLRASRDRLKKLKLLSGLRYLLSQGLVQMLQARGCRIRWVDKPLVMV